jgi:hypothetical protein
MKHVFSNWASTAGSWRILLEILELFQDPFRSHFSTKKKLLKTDPPNSVLTIHFLQMIFEKETERAFADQQAIVVLSDAKL